MNHLILQTATRFMLPLLLLFSVFLLLRGHNDPGGGFTGGLVGAAAFALYALAYSVDAAREALRVDPRTLIAVGLLTAIASSCLSLLLRQPLLVSRNLWTSLNIRGVGEVHVGPPLAFDLGVYLVVVGVALTIIWTLAEE